MVAGLQAELCALNSVLLARPESANVCCRQQREEGDTEGPETILGPAPELSWVPGCCTEGRIRETATRKELWAGLGQASNKKDAENTILLPKEKRKEKGCRGQETQGAKRSEGQITVIGKSAKEGPIFWKEVRRFNTLRFKDCGNHFEMSTEYLEMRI